MAAKNKEFIEVDANYVALIEYIKIAIRTNQTNQTWLKLACMFGEKQDLPIMKTDEKIINVKIVQFFGVQYLLQ